MAIITLLTDFGTQDEYVAVVKGVILGINPTVTLVDISHDVPPQGVGQAGDMLKAAFAWFPQGTIHVAVVDPDVGGRRAILAASLGGHLFMAPDNGLLTAVCADQPPDSLVRVENSRLFLHPVSATFHGRDIFAPVAAHLSLGMAMRELGPNICFSGAMRLERKEPVEIPGRDIIGQVVGTDHFGNLRTNIDARMLDRMHERYPGRGLVIHIGAHRIEGVSRHYAQKKTDGLIALVSSRNQLEIAVNGGSAAQLFPKPVGLEVRVTV